MAIIGTHMLLYSSEPEALRAMFRDVFGFESVDAGRGWLIFAMPPAELGVHPADGPTFDSGVSHQISMMCDDLQKTVAELRAKGVEIDGEPREERYGILMTMTLPGDVSMILYRPKHPLAIQT